jgi:MSHA biogenesis protein MshO
MRSIRGFTLIELIIVIILLAVVAGFSFQFVGIGAQMFTTGAERLQTIEKSRFAAERVTRELRNAVPNSIRIRSSGGVQCLEFTPVRAVGTYYDAPIRSRSDKMTLVTLSSLSNSWVAEPPDRIFIYATRSNFIYANNAQRYAVLAESYDSASASASTPATHILPLVADSRFAQSSPRERAYIGKQPVSFCLQNDGLYRVGNYGWNQSQTVPPVTLNESQLLAERLNMVKSSFLLEPGTSQRNNVINIQLEFVSRSNESIFYNQKVHIPNAP